jgi:hypothetical protein
MFRFLMARLFKGSELFIKSQGDVIGLGGILLMNQRDVDTYGTLPVMDP